MARKSNRPKEAQVSSPEGDPRIPETGNLSPDLDPAWRDPIRQRLVTWYEGAGRKLPWRESRDPYRILVSEMMLVQTTVTAVVPYFARFLDRFPTVADLASADEDNVLKAWEGLGYYRRARQLQAAAQVIVADHGGVFPDDPIAIRALPGVGRYIAGALLSFAFDRPAPIVEANTQRVLARWLAWDEDLKTVRSQNRLWEAASRIVPEVGPGTFNQAFMELGALVCIPRKPLCLACPVAGECLSRKLGVQDQIPRFVARTPPKAVSEACLLVVRDGKLLIVKRGKGRLWENFWEFPTVHLGGPDPAGRGLAEAGEIDLERGLIRLTGVRASIGPVSRIIRFGVTTHRVTLEAHLAEWLDGEPIPGPGLVEAAWESIDRLDGYTLSSASRRLVAWLSGSGLV
jgi:A/G-specific adenine glycosylase